MAATVFEIFSLGGKRFLSELSALSQLFPPKLKFVSPDFKPGFPISPWYRTHRINRRVLSLQGSDARSRTTEGDTWWVKKKTVRFSSHSTAC